MGITKYENDEDRRRAINESKNRYAKAKYLCETCNKEICNGHRWLHSQTYKHKLKEVNFEQRQLIESVEKMGLGYLLKNGFKTVIKKQ
jgi:hypothetical protein